MVATTALALALGGVFVHDFAAASWAERLPAWSVAALLVLAALAALASRPRAARRLWAAIVLAAGSFALLHLVPAETAGDTQQWRRDASRRLAQTVDAVGSEVARLEDVSSGLAAPVREQVASMPAGISSPANRTSAFALLDSLARVTAKSKSLRAGTAIGLQLFDARGERVAWAGWPQAVSLLDQVFLSSGTELEYTRTVSLYHILSHVAPCSTAAGERVATLLVDIPLEVDYRVNNRFLKSASLADAIPRNVAARVSFDYFPPTGNLPDRLPRFRAQQAAARANRDRMIAAARSRKHATAEDSTGAALTWEDSALSYFPFSSNAEAVGDVTGDEDSGLEGAVLIRSREGNPLLHVSAVSEPFTHVLEERAARRSLWGKGLAIVALIALFAQCADWIGSRRQPRHLAARAALFAAFMVALRYGLLAFGPGSQWIHSTLFDPSVFATPALGGLMRNAFDLVLTALFLVAMVYGLVRIARSADGSDAPAPDRRPGGRWIVAGSMAVACVNVVVFELARRFSSTVVVNANPRLLGETMAVTDVGVIALHVGIFLMITGMLLAGMFALWGLFRAAGDRRPARVCALGWVLVVGVCALEHRWEPALLSALVMLFVVFAPRIAHREDLVSVGIAAFCLVIASSATAYIYLGHDYDELRKGFVLEKSNEVTNPADNWKVVILEDVLGDYAERPEIQQAVRSPASQDIDRLAFDLWAESPLSLLGYSCAIHVVNADDGLVSEFSVDMPYRVRMDEGGERTDTPDRNQWAVLDLTRSTPQGVVRFYRGILNVDEGHLYEDAQNEDARTPPRRLGKVIIDVPFFFESLELAARTGPRTPEVLRNVQEGGVAPRVEEPEALLLARVDRDHRIVESSSEQFSVGMRVDGATIDRALAQAWPHVRSGGSTYRVLAVRMPETAETLLAGFLVPTPWRHLLRWSTLLSLYLFFAIALIALVVALGAAPRLGGVLPTLTPRRLGFQQKLLASFLVVALVPAVILGVFSANFIKGRFVEEARSEASYKASSARKAFVNLLHGELQFFLGRTDLSGVFNPKAPSVHDLGGDRVAMLFDDSALPDEVPGLPVAGAVADASTEDLVVADVNGRRYIGVFSAPLKVAGDAWIGSYYVYYARAVDGDLLAEIAEQVGADVNIYADGQLVASSREGLLAGGFISSSMNASAFVEVSMLGSDRTLTTERAGSYDFQVAYLPIDRWVPADSASSGAVVAASWGPAATRAAMGVPLLFRPESYSLEVQRATSVVLGVFALLLAATIALGLVVARGVFEPLRGLVAGTRRVSGGDFDVRLPERRSDEIGIVVSAFNEMTERIAGSQRALEERRRYLEAILENIGAGVVSTDAEGRVRTVNAAAERIAGAPSAALVGRSALELAEGTHAPAIFALLISKGGSKDGPGGGTPPAFASGELEIQGPEKRATVKYMRTRLEAEGRHFGTVLVFEDVTELIESKKLSAWVEMARQIAHEIKNPLTPIRLSTQFMRRAYEQKPAEFDRVFREGTETILQQVDVLKRIAGEFSSYGRMQRLQVRSHPVDPLVRHILAPYEHNAAVRLRYDNGASDAIVMADAEAVRKICANLIENAMEAMGENGAELRVRCAEGVEGGVRVVHIVFHDSGPGLSEDAAQRLFEPYFSTKTTGTGLGLAICRTLSREMGGDVTVRNAEDGRGTEATLTLRRGPQ
jgi:nitrogen fixation/metabolism regulation signal transduction histidine kinase